MPDVKQTISDFYKVAQERDFARDFHFRVLSINTDSSVTSVTFDEDDLVYVKTAALPGREISDVTVPYMGLPFHVPGIVSYPTSEGYSLTFYADAQSKIRSKFEEWSMATFDDASSTGNYNVPKASSTIDLLQLDANLDKLAQYQLVGVSPRSVGEMGYTMAEATGSALEFTATLAFHYWRKIG